MAHAAGMLIGGMMRCSTSHSTTSESTSLCPLRSALGKSRILTNIECGFWFENAEELNELGDKPRPAGLMACSQASAVVSVKVLIE